MNEISLYRYIEVLKNDGMRVKILVPSANGGEASEEEISEILRDTTVSGLYYDSRKCTDRGVFFCKGRHFLSEYIYDALEKGASAVIYGAPFGGEAEKAGHVSEKSRISAVVNEIKTAKGYVGRVFIETDNVRRAMAVLSAFHYGYPMKKIITVAVTGTKGKTGTVLGICNSLNEVSRFKAFILNDAVSGGSILTTPEPIELHAAAKDCVERGATHLICEISSQGMKEMRAYGIIFDIACFLNFGPDHISPFEHPTLEDYFRSKATLFSFCRRAVINSDCERAESITEVASGSENILTDPVTGKREIYTFSLLGKTADFSAEISESGGDGCLIDIAERNGAGGPLFINAAGDFNAQNALAAYSVCRLLGASSEEIFKGMLFSRPPGRMEIFDTADGRVRVIVDYAHNGMSFTALFEAVRRMYAYSPPGITAVFGCSGEKAYGRRYELPEVALKYADRIIICEEDSGREPFEVIRDDILSNINAILLKGAVYGLSDASVSVIRDRGRAILAAVEGALEDGEKRVILFTGKGRERTERRAEGDAPTVDDVTLALRAIARYNDRLSLEALFSGLGERVGEHITVSLDGGEDIIESFAVSAERLVRAGIAVTAVCDAKDAEKLREQCCKSGTAVLVTPYPSLSVSSENGASPCDRGASFERIALSAAKRGAVTAVAVKGSVRNAAAEIAVTAGSGALVYLSRSGGILLKGRAFPSVLSERAASLISEKTDSEHLRLALKAIRGGVGSVAVIDGRRKNALELYGIGRCDGTVIKRNK